MELTSERIDELYTKYSKKMVSIALRLGFTDEEAEDMVQDAFLLLMTKSELFQNGHDNPGGFLMETLRNLIGSKLRHRKIEKLVQYEKIHETGMTDTYFASLEDILPSELKEEEKALLIARYEEQISYAELSKRLGISESQCALKVFRTKKKYQKILEGEKKF